MGTRNLTCVVLNNEMKVAQYCQWDGYLSGQGKDIMHFISQKMDLKKFKQAISECVILTEEQIEARYLEVGIESDLINMKQADDLKKTFPAFSRDTGAKLLDLIQNKGIRELVDSSDFAASSLFCEFVYVLNLDNETLEVYEGFNKKALKKNERFYYLTDKAEGEYKPVRLVHTYTFKEIKENSFEQLEKKFKKKPKKVVEEV